MSISSEVFFLTSSSFNSRHFSALLTQSFPTNPKHIDFVLRITGRVPINFSRLKKENIHKHFKTHSATGFFFLSSKTQKLKKIRKKHRTKSTLLHSAFSSAYLCLSADPTHSQFDDISNQQITKYTHKIFNKYYVIIFKRRATAKIGKHTFMLLLCYEYEFAQRSHRKRARDGEKEKDRE